MQAEAATVSTAPAEDYISFEEYLTRYDSVEGMRTEWDAGKVMVYPVSNNVAHILASQLLHFVLYLFLSKRRIGQVFTAAFPMRVGNDKPAREPDLLVVLSDHLDRIRPSYLDGIADIVVEIISPESDARDRGTKFIEYEALGIPEYWLFDPLRQEATIYALGADAHYHRVPQDADGRLVSPLLPGFALPAALLWGETPPDAMALVALVQEMN